MSDIMISCATHLPAVTSWVDDYPVFKIIIPSLITGSAALLIGSLAYGVAYNQREIAANKYKLDLFDKRIAIYEEFKEDFGKLSKPSLDIRLFNNTVLKKKSMLLKCSRIFSGFECDFNTIQNMPEEILKNESSHAQFKPENYDIYFSSAEANIDSDIREQQENISDLEKSETNTPQLEYFLNYIRDAKMRLEFLEDVKKKWDEYKEEYHQRSKRKKEVSDKIENDKMIVDEAFKKISENIEEQLTLSHDPYKKKDKIYVLGFLFIIGDFFMKLTFKKPSE